MKEFTCIVCPNGCRLSIDETTKKVSGNKCLRGEKYAIEEITHPKRSLTTSVKTNIKEYPVISCRSDGEIPKELIFEAMKIINDVTIDKKVKIGSVVIENILGTGVNIITTTDMN